MKLLVILKKPVVCTNPSRKTMWHLSMRLPVSGDQFEIVARIIRSLRNIRDNFLIVDFAEAIGAASYMQIICNDSRSYRIEIHLDKPYAFGYEFGGKKKVRFHPYTQYSVIVSAQEAILIFERVLCQKRIPNLKLWRNCTREIYLEELKTKSPLSGETGKVILEDPDGKA